MKAMLFLGDCEAVVKEMPDPKPGPGQVLVRMKAAGLCGSDLHGQYEQPKQRIAERNKRLGREMIGGHEPCGVIEALGPNTRGVQVGDRVLVHHNVGCGECKLCRQGMYNLCIGPREKRGTYGFGLDGAFADFMVAEDRNCIKMPDWLAYDVGAHLTCGGGTVYSALKRLNITTDDVALAVGVGPVGLGGVAVMKAWGAKVIATDLSQERLKLAKIMGADIVIDASRENVLERVNEVTDNMGVNVAADFSGSAAGRNMAVDATGLFGRVAFVGEQNQRPEMTLDPTRQLLGKRITIYSSRVFGVPELMETVEFIHRHKIDFSKMITHRVPLEKAPEAVKLFQTTNTGKVVVVWP
ncbi:MAG: alcohol dehydrogenase catalytic domain-containing protein [Nitrososphaerota archaeon]